MAQPTPQDEAEAFLIDFFGVSGNDIEVASRQYKRKADGSGRLMRFLWIVQHYKRLCSTELTKNATSLPIVTSIFTISALTKGMYKKPKKKNKKKTKTESKSRAIEKILVSLYFSKFYNRSQKVTLLSSFVFSRSAIILPANGGVRRHLMYRGMLAKCKSDEYEIFESAHCSSLESLNNSYCYCVGWLNTQSDKIIDYYFKKLANHFYQMRCATVHDGVAPLISHVEEKPKEATSWNMTLSDIYLNFKRSKHYFYESSLSRLTYEQYFRESLWKAFQAGLPLK